MCAQGCGGLQLGCLSMHFASTLAKVVIVMVQGTGGPSGSAGRGSGAACFAHCPASWGAPDNAWALSTSLPPGPACRASALDTPPIPGALQTAQANLVSAWQALPP